MDIFFQKLSMDKNPESCPRGRFSRDKHCTELDSEI